MSKQLYVAFTAEGSTDEVFLEIIIRRTLEEISRQNDFAFSVEEVIWLGAAKGDNPYLAKAVEAYNEKGAQILVVHRDTDQHSRQFISDKHFAPFLASLPENIRSEMPIVPLIIRHEQETWLFADLDALNEVLDGKLDRQALNLPPDIETRANAKELFKQTIRNANQGQSRGRGFKEDTVAEALADKIRLPQLAKLPSYQQFVTDLETALCKIGYIR
jgi:hypothetical protein